MTFADLVTTFLAGILQTIAFYYGHQLVRTLSALFRTKRFLGSNHPTQEHVSLSIRYGAVLIVAVCLFIASLTTDLRVWLVDYIPDVYPVEPAALSSLLLAQFGWFSVMCCILAVGMYQYAGDLYDMTAGLSSPDLIQDTISSARWNKIAAGVFLFVGMAGLAFVIPQWLVFMFS